MKAIVRRQYGGPELFSLTEMDRPSIGDQEVLIKVHSVSLNPRDWHLMRGTPYLVRPSTGVYRPKQAVIGADLAGQIVSTGLGVTDFQPGDRVVADAYRSGMGAFAEYVRVKARDVVHLPNSLSYDEAAALPTAGLTAYHCFLNKGKLQPGDHILINGASGGVGTYAVQLAKALGAEVTAVCSTRNVELVSSLGADRVIDYKKRDFIHASQPYDFIMDNIANRSFSELRSILKPGGQGFVVGYYSDGKLFRQLALQPFVNLFSRRKLKPLIWSYQAEDLQVFLQAYLLKGKVKSVLDRVFPMEDMAEAMAYVETGRARGKVVVRMTPAQGAATPFKAMEPAYSARA